MQKLIIYHNGVCSKSNGALELLIREQIPHTVRWFMQEPLSAGELDALITASGLPVQDFVRINEPLYQENFGNAVLSKDDCLRILTQYPELLQRPVVALGNQVIIARPAEKVYALLKTGTID